MLTGRRVFAGEHVTDFVVAVMTKEPDWAALPAATLPRIVELLKRCWKKDPLRAPAATGDVHGTQSHWSWRLPLDALAAGLITGAATVGFWRVRPRSLSESPSPIPFTHTTIELPANAPLALGAQIPAIGFDSPAVAISPDGSRIAYVGKSGNESRLYLRNASALDSRPIPGTEGAISAFFSPDSRSIGFLTNDKLKKVSVDGGTPVTLCDARGPTRATWTADTPSTSARIKAHVCPVSLRKAASRQRLSSPSATCGVSARSYLMGNPR